MASLRPIVGHVVAAEHAAQVVAPPYDLLSPERRRDLASERPDSFLNVLPSGGSHDGGLHANARALQRLIDAGRLEPLDRPSLGVLQLDHAGRRTVAVIGDLEVSAFGDGRVLPHERIRPDRVQQLARHLEVVRIASSPVCVVHRPSAEVTALTDRVRATSSPTVSFVADDHVQVSLYLVAEPGLRDELAAAVADAGRLFVADGHHRAAAVAHADPVTGSVLTAVVPSDQLRVLAFHRRLDLAGAEPTPGVHDPLPARVLARCTELGLQPAALDGPAGPAGRGRVHLTVGGSWWALDLRERRADGPVESLDVRLVERELLGPLRELLGLGAGDGPGSADVDVVAVPAPTGLASLVRAGSIGLALHPPSVDDILAVAEAGEIMPSKSTYLAPKLRSGLLVVPR